DGDGRLELERARLRPHLESRTDDCGSGWIRKPLRRSRVRSDSISLTGSSDLGLKPTRDCSRQCFHLRPAAEAGELASHYLLSECFKPRQDLAQARNETIVMIQLCRSPGVHEAYTASAAVRKA